MVVPVSKAFEAYASETRDALRAAGFFVDVDLSHRTLNKMVRESQLAQYNYILVVGASEAQDGTVNVRTRDNQQHGVKPVKELIEEFKGLMENHTLDLDLNILDKAS